jgi:hypothetical protein
MGHDHDFYWLFSHFWWLLFPLFWAVGRMVRLYWEHQRAGQALDVIRAYAAQGKEIPPEVVKILQQPTETSLRQATRSPRDKARSFMIGGFFFIAVAIGFCMLILGRIAGNEREAYVGMTFVVTILLGFAATFFITSYLYHRDSNRLDPP